VVTAPYWTAEAVATGAETTPVATAPYDAVATGAAAVITGAAVTVAPYEAVGNTAPVVTAPVEMTGAADTVAP